MNHRCVCDWLCMSAYIILRPCSFVYVHPMQAIMHAYLLSSDTTYENSVHAYQGQEDLFWDSGCMYTFMIKESCYSLGIKLRLLIQKWFYFPAYCIKVFKTIGFDILFHDDNYDQLWEKGPIKIFIYYCPIFPWMALYFS